jgi:hypothetical protein
MAKTSRPMVRIHNAETNEIIDREMNDAEFAQYEIDKANTEAKAVEMQARADAKQALLERLGITADEAKLLIG